MATECPAPDGSSPQQRSFDGPMPMCIDPSAQYQVEIVTNHGTMNAFLYPQRAPKTVNNFVCLARYHYFDGLTFHRIIRDFVIQGGCPKGNGTGGPGYRFEDELPEPGKYEVGSLAMANAGPDTNGSQFFVISGGQGMRLPPQYSLFGKLIDGLDVLDEIQKVPTGAQDRPKDPVVIESVTVTETPAGS
jgi:cyclophilin family peptidyl-prolyl cis-trans isomerase